MGVDGRCGFRDSLSASPLVLGQVVCDRVPHAVELRGDTPIEIAHKTAADGGAMYGSIAAITIGRCPFRGAGWRGSVQEMSWMNAASGAARIVIVDDDDLFRESLGLNLIDEGYEVTRFSGGQAALNHFAAGGTADVVLLYWRMPEMNGLEVLRSLPRVGNSTPVIFLTVLHDHIYVDVPLACAAVGFIA